MNRLIIGSVVLAVVAALACVAFGLGGHSDGARVSAGVLAGITLICGVGLVARVR
jgi:hypothetical protein